MRWAGAKQAVSVGTYLLVGWQWPAILIFKLWSLTNFPNSIQKVDHYQAVQQLFLTIFLLMLSADLFKWRESQLYEDWFVYFEIYLNQIFPDGRERSRTPRVKLHVSISWQPFQTHEFLFHCPSFKMDAVEHLVSRSWKCVFR